MTGAAPPTPKLIARFPLRRQVRRIVLDRLVRGELPPGTGINESELASSLGVSRTPLREALLGLEREGFLRSEAGRGFFVVPLTAQDAEELYPILWTLERAALQAGGLPEPERLVELERIDAEWAGSGADPDQALRLDRQWHDTLLAGCTNRRLLEMIARLKDQARRYEYAYMLDSGRVIASIGQHHGIVEALRRGDLSGAAKLLESNWRTSLDFLRPWLAAGPGSKAVTRADPGPSS